MSLTGDMIDASVDSLIDETRSGRDRHLRRATSCCAPRSDGQSCSHGHDMFDGRTAQDVCAIDCDLVAALAVRMIVAGLAAAATAIGLGQGTHGHLNIDDLACTSLPLPADSASRSTIVDRSLES